MPRRVVVPLDGSRTAEAIVPFLLEIGWPLARELVLVRVLEPRADEPTPPGADMGTHRADAEADLAPFATRLRAAGIETRTEVRVGSPVEEILAAARERDADLIAMTTRGGGGTKGAPFGSVAEAVVRQASVPVFLLRLTEAELVSQQADEPAGGSVRDRKHRR